MLYSSTEYKTKNASKLVFFLCPYGFKLRGFKIPIRKLQKAGFAVIGYDFSKSVLSRGDPAILARCIDEVRTDAAQQIAAYKTAGFTSFGFFGSSLGAFIGYNLLTLADLKWGVMNTGGGVADAIWSKRDLRDVYIPRGYTFESLEQTWLPLQYPEFPSLKNRRLLMITSTNDKMIPQKSSIKCFDHLKAAGADVRYIKLRGLSHGATVLYNLSRIIRLVKKVT